MSKLTTLVAAAAIGIAAWNGYDAYTKRQELETTRQQLGTTTTVYLHAEQQLLTATEKLNKAQSQLDAMAAEEQKAETNLEVALTRGKNILNGVLPRGYQEGTVAVEGGDTPLGPVLGSFQGPLSAQVKDCSAGMRLFSDKKVTVQSLYAAVLTTQVVQNEPSVVVLAGTVKIPEEARKAFYEKMKNQPMIRKNLPLWLSMRLNKIIQILRILSQPWLVIIKKKSQQESRYFRMCMHN